MVPFAGVGIAGSAHIGGAGRLFALELAARRGTLTAGVGFAARPRALRRRALNSVPRDSERRAYRLADRARVGGRL
jgi:hypothetical protein